MNHKIIKDISLFLLIVIILLWILPLILLLLLSIAQGWTWPQILPSAFSFKGWAYVFSSASGSIRAIFTSIEIALIVTIINLILSLQAGDALGRYDFYGKKLIEIILLTPIIFPPLVIMMGMHITFIKLNLTETKIGVIIAHIIPTLPYMIRALTISFKHLGTKWEEQAKVLGAGKIHTFFYITYPFLLPGIVAGSSLTILISLSQYIITLFIGGGQVITLSMVMFPFFNGGNESVGAAYSIIFAAIALSLMIIMDRILIKYYKRSKIS